MNRNSGFQQIVQGAKNIELYAFDGTLLTPIPFLEGRWDFGGNQDVIIYDKFLGNKYWTDVSLIKDDTAEVKSTGTVTLTGGASGTVDGITVDGVEVMSGAVAFITDLATTATAVALNITNNTSIPNYTAVAVGAAITITYEGANNEDANTFVVVASATTITTSKVDMASGVTGLLLTKAAISTYLSAFVGVTPA